MATHLIHTTFAVDKQANKNTGIFAKYAAYVNSQSSNAVLWWVVSLLFHGCFLVPLTFLLVYSLSGPTTPFLTISLAGFFVNFVGNMGGASFKFNFNSSVISTLIHVLMAGSTLLMVL